VAVSFELLVHCSTLTRIQYGQYRDLAQLQAGVLDLAAIDEGIEAGVDKRLELAEMFLTCANRLCPPAGTAMDEISARNAVSRAYYAIHHAVRALLLYEEHGDVDGHQETIKAVTGLIIRVPAARAKIGGAKEFGDKLQEVLHQRHLADYYLYGTAVPREVPLDFPTAATELLSFAAETLGKVRQYIAEKRAGIL
jgi:uncharacterized protein (UPF0332 family)